MSSWIWFGEVSITEGPGIGRGLDMERASFESISVSIVGYRHGHHFSLVSLGFLDCLDLSLSIFTYHNLISKSENSRVACISVASSAPGLMSVMRI